MASREAPGEPLGLIRTALQHWHVEGSVAWSKQPHITKWLEENLDRSKFTNQSIARRMYEFLQRGGQVREQDRHPEDPFDHDVWYYMILPLDGREIFIKFVISDDDPDCPCITIVSIHKQSR
ncbi:MAG: hypothetical protein KJZ69_09550 [Phycisphaerales bacterium]|nr:hypothetical protein [Phycisphaerales bacterium]